MTNTSEGLPAQDFVPSTRDAYDAIAVEYADEHADWLADRPLDQALVSSFADLTREHAPAPVADLGSGPGFVTARLRDLGVPVFGVDLSPRMVEMARRAHPDLRFHVGSMTSLDLPDGTLGGVVALFSIIHVPDHHLVGLFEEIRRVLVPGAPVLLSFQSGDQDEHVHLTERYGHEIALDYYMRATGTVTEALAKAGLTVRSQTVREPQGEEKWAKTFVVASRP
ncbi:class I SAM-dependent DNA methyltransferase [Streptomyces sp. NPDC056716]|uniref:class I SAM-dependent DNA methyltransferase n=1 Tax=unclassified Streptomyces TaxID=2593676 RepID=UPI003699B5CC